MHYSLFSRNQTEELQVYAVAGNASIDDAEGRISAEEDRNSTYKHIKEHSLLYRDLPKHKDEDDFSYEECDGTCCCVTEEEDVEAKFAKITEISSLSGSGEEEERERY